jgi:hypothetical protein
MGHACFLPVEGGPRVQRLLVLRAARSAAPAPDAGAGFGPVAPLAVRAGVGIVRGSRD